MLVVKEMQIKLRDTTLTTIGKRFLNTDKFKSVEQLEFLYIVGGICQILLLFWKMF